LSKPLRPGLDDPFNGGAEALPSIVSRFLDAAWEDRLCALYVLAIAAGLRFGELLGLRWEDVDLETRRLTVRHQLQRGEDGKPTLAPPKTAKARFTLGLSETATEAVRRHRIRQLRERMQVADIWQDQG
jgi:integrase